MSVVCHPPAEADSLYMPNLRKAQLSTWDVRVNLCEAIEEEEEDAMKVK